MTAPVLVTGATGHVGRETVDALVRRGAPVRAALRDPSRARFPAGVEAAALDFLDARTYPAAFAGVERALLVRPPHLADPRREVRPAIDAMKEAGVRHVVFLSLQGVNPFVPHWRIEKDLESSGMAYTHLRAGFFMQNLETMHADGIRRRDAIEIPAGRGRTSFIDVRDIAEVAAAALTERGHEDRAYVLTGREALDYDAVARIMTEVLGREIRYPRLSREAFAARMREAGHPDAFVKVVSRIYLVVRLHLAGRMTRDVQRVLGRPPRTFREYARDRAHVWARA